MNRRLLFSLTSLAALAAGTPLQARPILTEEVATIGPRAFEVHLSGSLREDEFGTPKNSYRTVNVPLEMKLGVMSRLDLGFLVEYTSHRLDTGETLLSGSSTGRFSPKIKWALNDYAGLEGIWHTAVHENTDEEISVAQGQDFELLALLKAPGNLPIHLNTGVLIRGPYHSRFGIKARPRAKVEPGTIFENRLSVEFPLPFHLGLLAEGTYYRVGKQKVDGVAVDDTDGDAADLLGGLTWNWGGWNLAGGIAFGLLDESHTSFDLYRGAGDVTYHFTAAYRLTPRKPNYEE